MTVRERPLRVCLDARLQSGIAGGVEQFIIGLADGLCRLPDGDEEYVFLTYAGADEWLRPYLREPHRIVAVPPKPNAASSSPSRRLLKLLSRARNGVCRLSRLTERWSVQVPRSDGTVESLHADIMHFTMQGAFLTDVPSIYHPWDLQHRHLPQLFSRRDWVYREVTYPAFCRQARLVAVASEWTKRDLMRHYALSDEKVQVVSVGPVLAAYPTPTPDDLEAARRKFSLPPAFAFYPAQTWPHKNHLALLEALALLRDRHGLQVPLVSSGHRNEFFARIEARARELALQAQVQFPGFVTPLELACLYRLCRCVVFPSRFEGWGLPVAEAFGAGAPVACSNAASLPEVAGEAALLFDPDDPAQIAATLARLWNDEPLRRALSERGRERAAQWSNERTAQGFRAHYRRIAGRPLDEEDRALLSSSNGA